MTDALSALEARVAALPALILPDATAETPDLDPAGVRRVVTTGVGSSAAHARFLAHLLAELVGLDARFVPASAPPPPRADDVLVVFSQGLSPNGRLPLARLGGWRAVVAGTAVTRGERLAALRAAGVHVLGFAGEDEFGTLVRVTGPLLGYLAAWRLATRLGARAGRPLPALDRARLAARVAAAGDAVAGLGHAVLDPPLAFVTSGAYGELVANLQYKVLEGCLGPCPPVWDVLHVAHGPLQQLAAHPATLLALARADARGEAALLERLEAVLVPTRHRLVRLAATLPGPLAVLEHEMQLNTLVLAWLRAHPAVDQAAWPGRGTEEPLYALERLPEARRLAELTWPELEVLGARTAVVPLGSTEQHGPHLPFATDTWIGDALAERVCARLVDAVALPTLPVGCSGEHAAFPGTLTLRAETLAAALGDVLASLRRHGFARALVFSAHGGNVEPLRHALPGLRAAAAPLEVVAFTDLEGLTVALHEAAASAGVDPGAAGHHAGEIETSILLALRPHAVRVAAAVPGRTVPTAGAQALFHPDLRPHAPTGVVGDPTDARASRGLRYLETWVALLVAAFDAAKKDSTANGTQSA